jgi:hypothetical protein
LGLLKASFVEAVGHSSYCLKLNQFGYLSLTFANGSIILPTHTVACLNTFHGGITAINSLEIVKWQPIPLSQAFGLPESHLLENGTGALGSQWECGLYQGRTLLMAPHMGSDDFWYPNLRLRMLQEGFHEVWYLENPTLPLAYPPFYQASLGALGVEDWLSFPEEIRTRPGLDQKVSSYIWHWHIPGTAIYEIGKHIPTSAVYPPSPLPFSDYDGDGVPALLEYAFNPGQYGFTDPPTRLALRGTAADPWYDIPTPASRSDVRLILEESTNLTTWSAVVPQPQIAPGAETGRSRMPLPVSPGVSKFFRLKAEFVN